MALLLDVATVSAVIAALAFVLRPRRKASCGAAPAGRAESRIPLERLRESARRASGRATGRPSAR